jgi:hypothetical protein
VRRGVGHVLGAHGHGVADLVGVAVGLLDRGGAREVGRGGEVRGHGSFGRLGVGHGVIGGVGEGDHPTIVPLTRRCG